MTRVKLAQLTSGIGAVVLGIGLGALLPTWFGPAASALTAIGLVMHAFGMWDAHRLEAAGANDGWQNTVAYWLCWLLLIGVAVAMIGRRWW